MKIFPRNTLPILITLQLLLFNEKLLEENTFFMYKTVSILITLQLLMLGKILRNIYFNLQYVGSNNVDICLDSLGGIEKRF